MPRPLVLDANVLFSARLRDLMLQLAASGVICLCLTDAIDREWTHALLRRCADLAEAIERTRRLIRQSFARAYLEPSDMPAVVFGLPDPGDEHVARAALAVGGDIVTMNVADFPAQALQAFGLAAITPDDALQRLAEADAEGVLEAVRAILKRLRTPPVTPGDYANGMADVGCPDFADWLRAREADLRPPLE